MRYFLDEQEEVELSEEARERLSRTLAKVDKMKRNYWISGENEEAGESSSGTFMSVLSESVEKIVPSVPLSRPPIGDLPNFIPF